jgi:signal peptidase II
MSKLISRPTFRIALAFAIAIAIAAIDQLIKNLIVANFHTFEVKPFLGDLIKLTYVLNDSAAFSMGFGLTGIFTLISSAAVIALIWFIVAKANTLSWSIMAAVLLGGVAGNLIDRFVRFPGSGLGRVVDYIQIPFNFPVFNLADSAIVVIASLTVIRVLLGHSLGKASTPSND